MTNGASTPFMMTAAHKQRLAALGYTDEQIHKLTPSEAHDIFAEYDAPAAHTNGNGKPPEALSKLEIIERIRANFPKELQELNQWVTWRIEERKGKLTKVPYNINGLKEVMASSVDPMTWTRFDRAINAYKNGNYDGVGFVFFEDDPYAGVDFDKCITDEVMEPQRAEWLERLDSYSEYSPSGTGAHTFVIGALPPGGRKSTEQRVEMYDQARFFTVTGDHIPGTPRGIIERDEQLKELHAEIFPKKDAPDKPKTPAQSSQSAIPSDDKELLDRMFASKNGAAIRKLWDGDTTAHNDDASAADQALCNHLAFWTAKDAQRMDRMFRQSGLMRDKWDRNARSGETYGEGTIREAIEKTTEVYSPTPRYVPLSEQIERDLKAWGYNLWLNDMDDSIWIDDKRMDDPDRATCRMKARDAGYGGKGNKRTLGALEDSWLAIAAKNRRHPVREWLNAQTWDGTNHIAHLSSFFTGKPDDDGNEPTVKYDDGTERTVFHAFLRRWLVGAVAKQMGDESAVRSNFVLTLTGGQDDGKSHFANWICPLQDYFVEGSISPENKDHMLLRTKSLVWEVKELGHTTKKADVEALKGFITGVITAERKAYGHFETRKTSVASYVGTVNLDGGGFLSDVTGNRRFAVVDLKCIDWAYSEKVNLPQVWAQAVALWRADPKAYRFSPEEVKVRDNAAENHMEVDIFADMLVRIFEIDPSKTAEIDWRMSSSDILEKLRTYAGLSRGNDRVQGRDLSKSLQKNWGIKSRRSNGLTYYDGLKLRDLSTAAAAVAGMMAGL